jgi:hypothetical protein
MFASDGEKQAAVKQILSLFEKIELDDHELTAVASGIDFGKSDPKVFVGPIEQLALFCRVIGANA